jgi:hypothetical protein
MSESASTSPSVQERCPEEAYGSLGKADGLIAAAAAHHRLLAGRILEAILHRGELPRSEVDAITGTGDRQGRRILSALLDRGVLSSESSRGPAALVPTEPSLGEVAVARGNRDGSLFRGCALAAAPDGVLYVQTSREAWKIAR